MEIGERRLPYPETYPECYVRAHTDDGLELVIDMSHPIRPKVERVIDRETGHTYIWNLKDQREISDHKDRRKLSSPESIPF